MGDGEWGMGIGKREMANSKQGRGNGECEWGMENEMGKMKI